MNRSIAMAAVAVAALALAGLLLIRSPEPPPPHDATPPGPTEPVPVPAPPSQASLLEATAGLIPPNAEAVYVIRGARALVEQTGLGPILDDPALAPLRVAMTAALPFDPSRPDTMRAVGFDPDAPWIVVFGENGRVLAWVPTSDGERAGETLVRWAEEQVGPVTTDAAVPDAWAVEAGELVFFVRDGRLGLVLGARLGAVEDLVAGARAGADAWRSRTAALRPHEPEGALLVTWASDVDGQPPLVLDRTGDPDADRWLALAEQAANASAFYGEGDALITITTPGGGLTMGTTSVVKNPKAARAALSTACDVDAAWLALSGGAFRVVGASRVADLEPIAAVMRDLPGSPLGSALTTFDAAWAEAGLGEAMWGEGDRLRCLLASMAPEGRQLVVGAQVGAGQGEGVTRLLRAVLATLDDADPVAPHAEGSASTWDLGADMGCRYAGDLLACGTRAGLERAMERISRSAPKTDGRRSILRVEADLHALGSLLLERLAADPMTGTIAHRLITALGTLRYEEVLDGDLAHITLTATGAENGGPLVGAVVRALLP